VELGIAQASEIVPNAGAQLVGPLPGELGSMTQFSGGIGAAGRISGFDERKNGNSFDARCSSRM
jgi:hypothetical protein